MKSRRFVLSLGLLGLLSVGARVYAEEPPVKKGAPQAGSSEKPRDSLPEPDYLPEDARRVLKKKMARHGKDMVELMLSVTLLRYDVAREAAQRIASEPRMARPIVGGEGDVNAALPERFFVLQDEARMRAREVRDAAAKRNDKALAESFGRLTETCVSCHSAYLNPPR